jgi:hypothetical protein
MGATLAPTLDCKASLMCSLLQQRQTRHGVATRRIKNVKSPIEEILPSQEVEMLTDLLCPVDHAQHCTVYFPLENLMGGSSTDRVTEDFAASVDVRI